MSESLTFMHKLRQGLSGLLGGAAEPVAATAQGLPVNLGGYEFARTSPGAAARLYGVDRALVWVVVALLMWGMVMVYSASIAMPDNPRFARYAQTHFLTRHIISLVLGSVVALLAFQIPMETWEKWARPMFVLLLRSEFQRCKELRHQTSRLLHGMLQVHQFRIHRSGKPNRVSCLQSFL